jgi:hypothetical protein
LVIQFFEPLMTKLPSPSRSPRVFMVRASEPLEGSVSAKQPEHGRRLARAPASASSAPSLPKRMQGSQTSELLTLMITPQLAHARLISSTTSA